MFLRQRFVQQRVEGGGASRLGERRERGKSGREGIVEHAAVRGWIAEGRLVVGQALELLVVKPVRRGRVPVGAVRVEGDRLPVGPDLLTLVAVPELHEHEA